MLTRQTVNANLPLTMQLQANETLVFFADLVQDSARIWITSERIIIWQWQSGWSEMFGMRVTALQSWAIRSVRTRGPSRWGWAILFISALFEGLLLVQGFVSQAIPSGSTSGAWDGGVAIFGALILLSLFIIAMAGWRTVLTLYGTSNQPLHDLQISRRWRNGKMAELVARLADLCAQLR